MVLPNMGRISQLVLFAISLMAVSCGQGGNGSASTTHAASGYRAAEITALGTGSAGLSINDSGAITGYRTVKGTKQAIVYSGGVATEAAPGYAYSAAFSTDQANRAAGELDAPRQKAFIVHDGMVELVNLPQALMSSARAVNGNGLSAGFFYDGSSYQGFVKNDSGIEAVGIPGQHVFINDINIAGHAAGHMEAGGSFHAILYRNGTIFDIGTLGGQYSSLSSINDSGDAAGTSELGDGTYRAFIYDGSMKDLGAGDGVESGANSINNIGQAVGWIRLTDGSQRGFLYDKGATVDLNTLASSPCKITDALDINNRGEISAVCGTDDGTRVVLLTPY